MQSMVELLRARRFGIEEYVETMRATHDLLVTSAHNEYLLDSMAPLQGLSRRFRLTHIADEQAEMEAGTRLHLVMLGAILDRDPDAAEAASNELNDYLVDFAYATLKRRHPAQ